MIFSYKAQTFEGDNVSGTLEADNKVTAKNMLLQRKLIIGSITEVKPKTEISFLKQRVKRKEMIFVFKNLSTMIRAGIPIMQSIDIMEEQVKQVAFKKALRKIKIDLSKGLLLSESIAETRMFPTLVPAILRIGEEAGNLDKSFLQLAEFYLKQDKTSAKIVGAMIYPAITMLVAVGAVYYLTSDVLPKILKALNASNPEQEVWLPTKILMAIANFFETYKFWPLLGFVVFMMVMGWLSMTALKKQKDYLLLKLPLYGPLIKKTKAVQFTTTLAILTDAGINITDALEIIAHVLGNEAFRDNIKAVRLGVIKGEPISKNLSLKLFDKLVVTIVSIGESTGDMQKPLQDIAEFLDEEVDRTVTNMINMITPLSILFMAVVVGFIVMGVMGPMFSMYGNFK